MKQTFKDNLLVAAAAVLLIAVGVRAGIWVANVSRIVASAPAYYGAMDELQTDYNRRQAALQAQQEPAKK